jgi:hypothetical protein
MGKNNQHKLLCLNIGRDPNTGYGEATLFALRMLFLDPQSSPISMKKRDNTR